MIKKKKDEVGRMIYPSPDNEPLNVLLESGLVESDVLNFSDISVVTPKTIGVIDETPDVLKNKVE